MRRRWLIVVTTVTLAFSAIGLGWLYSHPPLESDGISDRHDEQGRILVYGIGLRNSGRWPLTLTAVTLDGQVVQYPEAMAVANFTDGQLAFNAAAMMEEYGYKLTVGPVKGWRIEPRRDLTLPGASYGLRVDWEGKADHVEVVVHYRYLGLHMRCSVTTDGPYLTRPAFSTDPIAMRAGVG